MLSRFILLIILTRTISYFLFFGFLKHYCFFRPTTNRTGRKLQEELRALPKAVMSQTAAHKHICQWLWCKFWAAAWSRLMAGCSREGICFECAVGTW